LSCFTLRLHYRRQFGPLAVAKRPKDVIVDVRKLLSGLELEDGQTRGESENSSISKHLLIRLIDGLQQFDRSMERRR
jgi:hypothetical protein